MHQKQKVTSARQYQTNKNVSNSRLNSLILSYPKPWVAVFSIAGVVLSGHPSVSEMT